jgi:hypothetical protein
VIPRGQDALPHMEGYVLTRGLNISRARRKWLVLKGKNIFGTWRKCWLVLKGNHLMHRTHSSELSSLYLVIFQVLIAVSMKSTTFFYIVLYSLVEVDLCSIITLMMEAVRTSETGYFNKTTCHYTS